MWEKLSLCIRKVLTEIKNTNFCRKEIKDSCETIQWRVEWNKQSREWGDHTGRHTTRWRQSRFPLLRLLWWPWRCLIIDRHRGAQKWLSRRKRLPSSRLKIWRWQGRKWMWPLFRMLVEFFRSRKDLRSSNCVEMRCAPFKMKGNSREKINSQSRCKLVSIVAVGACRWKSAFEKKWFIKTDHLDQWFQTKEQECKQSWSRILHRMRKQSHQRYCQLQIPTLWQPSAFSNKSEAWAYFRPGAAPSRHSQMQVLFFPFNVVADAMERDEPIIKLGAAMSVQHGNQLIPRAVVRGN